jgi:hypothetical protein
VIHHESPIDATVQATQIASGWGAKPEPVNSTNLGYSQNLFSDAAQETVFVHVFERAAPAMGCDREIFMFLRYCRTVL